MGQALLDGLAGDGLGEQNAGGAVAAGQPGRAAGGADDVRAAGGVDLVGVTEPGSVAWAELLQRGQMHWDHGG